MNSELWFPAEALARSSEVRDLPAEVCPSSPQSLCSVSLQSSWSYYTGFVSMAEQSGRTQ